jgi:hypothetical protein
MKSSNFIEGLCRVKGTRGTSQKDYLCNVKNDKILAVLLITRTDRHSNKVLVFTEIGNRLRYTY